ncbi:MAG: hypothetical protein JW860_06360 [Sedimentisphaerales bacterium]|nr:hypothetical protein [Sedimentisphaerales bacterium]
MDPIYKRYIKTVAVIWTVCFCLFIVFYTLALLPQEDELIEISSKHEKARRNYEQAQSIASDLSRDKLSDQVKELKLVLSDYITDFNVISNEIFRINKMMGEIELGSFKSSSKPITNYKNFPNCSQVGEIPFEFNFTCDFPLFVEIINLLERHKPIVFVDQFEIIRSPDNNKGHKVKISLSLFTREPDPTEKEIEAILFEELQNNPDNNESSGTDNENHSDS